MTKEIFLRKTHKSMRFFHAAIETVYNEREGKKKEGEAMKPIVYFQEIIQNIKSGLDLYNMCSITEETDETFAFQHIKTKAVRRIEFLEKETYQLMENLPFEVVASVSQRIKHSGSVMYEMNIRMKETDYLIELDMYESEPGRDGRIDPAMYKRIKAERWKFYGVEAIVQNKQEKKHCLMLLEACENLIAEMPIYRLRFATGELEFGEDVKERLQS